MNIMGATNTRFEHASTPHWNRKGGAEIVYAQRREIPSHAPDLDVHDTCRIGLQSLAGVFDRANAFIKTKRRFEPLLQYCVIVDVIPSQWLLDIVKRESVELLQ